MNINFILVSDEHTYLIATSYHVEKFHAMTLTMPNVELIQDIFIYYNIFKFQVPDIEHMLPQ